MVHERPASAGRLVLAMLASAGLHAVLILSAAGSPAGGITPANYIHALLRAQPPALLQFIARPQEDAQDGDLQVPAQSAAPAAAEPASEPKPAATTDEMPAAAEPVIPFGTAPRYYLAHELDVRPQIKTRVEPDYPAAAAEQGLSGAFQTRIYIDESGQVERVLVPEDRDADLFAAAVVKAFLAARYTPGIKDGKPVRSLVILEIKFETAPPEDFRANRY